MDVVIVFVNHGMASTAIAPMEVFRSAGTLGKQLRGHQGTPLFRVQTASIDGQTVCPDGPITVTPDRSIKAIRHADLILIPATGLPVSQVVERHGALIPWIKRWHRRGAGIAGICTGVALLAEAGLLDGKEATTHWAVVNEYCERYPQVHWKPRRFITEADNVYCGGGVYAALDLSLYLVEKFAGHEVAVETAKALLIDRPRTWQAGYSIPPRRSGHSDDRILQAQRWLQEHFTGDVNLGELAAGLGMSPRNFARRFKNALGQTPLAYLQQLRIDRSKHLLEKDYKTIQEVASSVGYEDLIFFRRLFKRHTGISPQSYRRRFGMDTP